MTRPFKKVLLRFLLLIITIGCAVAAQAQQTDDTLVVALQEAREAGISETTLSQLLALGYEKQFEPSGMAKLLPILAQCQRENLPLEPFLSKIEEGISKRIPASQIAQVLKTRLEDYRFTRSLIEETLGIRGKVEPVSSESHIRLTETLYCGLSRENLGHLLSAFPTTPLPVVSRGAEVLASLKQVHFDSELAEQIVDTGMKQGYFTAEQREFSQIVAVAKRKGLQDDQIASAAMAVMDSGGSRDDFSSQLGITDQDRSSHGPQLPESNPTSRNRQEKVGAGRDSVTIHGVGPGSKAPNTIASSEVGDTSDSVKGSEAVDTSGTGKASNSVSGLDVSKGSKIIKGSEVVDTSDTGKTTNSASGSAVSKSSKSIKGSDAGDTSGSGKTSNSGSGSTVSKDSKSAKGSDSVITSDRGEASNSASGSDLTKGSKSVKGSDFVPTSATGQGSGATESAGSGRDSGGSHYPAYSGKGQQKRQNVTFAAAGTIAGIDPEATTLTLDIDKAYHVPEGYSGTFAISKTVKVKTESSNVGVFDLGLGDIMVGEDYARVLGRKLADGTYLITHIVLHLDGQEGSGTLFAAAGTVAGMDPDALTLSLDVDEAYGVPKDNGSMFTVSENVEVRTKGSKVGVFDLGLGDIVVGEDYTRVFGRKLADGTHLITHVVLCLED
jgi:hypothetical protein